MIEQNLGNLERVLRFLAGAGLLLWAATRPFLNGIEWFVVLVSVALLLNGIFCRCYLWYLLDINTCNTRRDKGPADPGCI